MTRIRTFRVLLCLLLLACCLPKGACHRRDGRRRGRERGVTRSSERRLQGNDKNVTPSPTVAPTLVPTTAPSSSPMIAAPSLSPNAPIVAPALPVSTNSPTFEVMEDAVGSLAMRLYVVDDTASASNVNEGRSSDLVQGVTAGLLEVQCQVGLVMVLENNVDGTNVCDSGRRRRLQREDDSVLWTAAQVAVTDRETENGEKYMDWTLVFPVLQIGAYYVNIGGDEAMAAMQAETETALAEYIQGGFMDAKLLDTAKAYAVDQDIEDTDNGDSLDTEPFHALRMTGVVLFIVTVVLTFLLFKISSRRMLERETDDAFAKLKLGGLVTEEGLDLMLETGRRESLEVELRGQNSREEMLVSSKSNVQANGNGNDDDNDDDDKGVWFRYLPSTLSPTKGETSQATTKDEKGGQKDAGLDLCDSNLNVAKSVEGLGEAMEESVAGFLTRMFSENPNNAESKK